MNEFLKRWKNDNKYRTKIKLIIYTIFILIVSVYALSINKEVIKEDLQENNSIDNINIDKDYNTENSNINIIDTSNIYKETIKIKINNQEIIYEIIKKDDKKTITKQFNDNKINYIYQNGQYYELINDNYFITNKDLVYDIVNYNYIDISTINEYLKKSNNNDDNQYLIYLKDVVLGINNEDYFVIMINNNKINIDYTPLMKYFDKSINQYNVEIILEKNER